MKTIDRIDKLLDQAGISEREKKVKLASICGVSYESVRKWYSGQTAAIDTEHLASISKYFKVPLDWVATGKGALEKNTQLAVPILKLNEIAAYLSGGFIPTRNAGLFSVHIREATGSSIQTFALVLQSEGMSPRISKDDIVYIDPSQRDCGDGIYLFDVGVDKPVYELGAIQETPRGLVLLFDNPSPGWEPIPVTHDKCIGKLVSFQPSWI